MTVTAATPAYGVTIQVGSNVIAEATNIDGPAPEREMLDVTNLSSPNAAKEFIAGLIDGGEVTISVTYLPQNTSHKALLTSLNSSPQSPASCTVTWSDSGASTCTFSALVKSFKPKANVSGALTADFGLKITGPVTWPS